MLRWKRESIEPLPEDLFDLTNELAGLWVDKRHLAISLDLFYDINLFVILELKVKEGLAKVIHCDLGLLCIALKLDLERTAIDFLRQSVD